MRGLQARAAHRAHVGKFIRSCSSAVEGPASQLGLGLQPSAAQVLASRRRKPSLRRVRDMRVSFPCSVLAEETFPAKKKFWCFGANPMSAIIACNMIEMKMQ